LTLFPFHVLPRSANRPDHSSLECCRPGIRDSAERAHCRRYHHGSVAAEGRSKQSGAMFVLCVRVRISQRSLKSPLQFLQALEEGSINSGKELKILLGEKTFRAVGGPLRSRFLDLLEIFCYGELRQGNFSLFSSRGFCHSTTFPYYLLLPDDSESKPRFNMRIRMRETCGPRCSYGLDNHILIVY